MYKMVNEFVIEALNSVSLIGDLATLRYCVIVDSYWMPISQELIDKCDAMVKAGYLVVTPNTEEGYEYLKRYWITNAGRELLYSTVAKYIYSQLDEIRIRTQKLNKRLDAITIVRSEIIKESENENSPRSDN